MLNRRQHKLRLFILPSGQIVTTNNGTESENCRSILEESANYKSVKPYAHSKRLTSNLEKNQIETESYYSINQSVMDLSQLQDKTHHKTIFAIQLILLCLLTNSQCLLFQISIC